MSMAALCRAFGISRQAGYQWIKRFSPRLGAASLQKMSCARSSLAGASFRTGGPATASPAIRSP